jgi:hypothetical protein
LAVVCGFLLLLTLIWRDWIEEAFGVDPDGGSGALEWAIVIGLALALVVCGALARTELRRSGATAGSRP